MALRRPAKRYGPEELYDYGVRALERRPLTERELRSRLTQRALEPRHIDEVVERLRGVGYLNDSRTAESHAYYRKEFQRLGRRRVLSELRQRGVDATVAERTVAEAYHEVDELNLIRDHLRRKLGCDPDARLADPKAFQRCVRALQRAGFTSGKIMEALGKLASEPEWLEGLEDAFTADSDASPSA